jgi:F-type H+-transporting ATPase subunit a
VQRRDNEQEGSVSIDPTRVEGDSQAVADPTLAVSEPPRRSIRPILLGLIALVVVLDVAAFILVPPFDPEHRSEGAAGFQYPRSGILANFEFPAPHTIIDLDPTEPPKHDLLIFDLTISSSLFTQWLVMALVLLVVFLLTRGLSLIPGRRQNVIEYAYEGLSDFAISLGGPRARRYVPIFAAFFLFILFANWSGLLPAVGRVEFLRAPTSDVNVTLGLALVSFVLFHAEGVRALGVGGYLGKFFNFGAFREGVGAGFIALFVGLIEFLLEFVKPITLAMRLFGNIFGGELALGVITALTIAVVPVALIGLEFLLNFIQALIFSVLTLMFTLAAIEGHHEDHGTEHPLEEIPEGSIAPDPSRAHHGAAAG